MSEPRRPAQCDCGRLRESVDEMSGLIRANLRNVATSARQVEYLKTWQDEGTALLGPAARVELNEQLNIAANRFQSDNTTHAAAMFMSQPLHCGQPGVPANECVSPPADILIDQIAQLGVTQAREEIARGRGARPNYRLY